MVDTKKSSWPTEKCAQDRLKALHLWLANIKEF